MGAILGIALSLMLFVGYFGVIIAKGQWAKLIAVPLLIGPLLFVVPFRLAIPGSWWARRFYGPEKLARAAARYPSDAAAVAEHRAEMDRVWGDDLSDEMDRTTRRALRRAGKL